MQERRLLTIAIPTFNRRDCLEQTLESIVSQAVPIDTYEIVLSDNASEDGTDALIARYCHRYANVRFIRHPENIGPDKNFIKLMQQAHGEYIKLLSDTKPLVDNALKRILEILATKRPAVLFNSNGVLGLVGGLRQINSLDSFIDTASFYCTWLPTITIRREYWESLEEKDAAAGTFLIQTDWLLRIVRAHPKIIISDDVIMRDIAPFSKSGYNFYQVFVSNYLSLLNSYVGTSDLSKHTFEREKRKLLDKFIYPLTIKIFLTARKQYQFDTKGAFRIMARNFGLRIFLSAYPFYLFKKLLNRIINRIRLL